MAMYNYQTERPYVLSEEGRNMFESIKHNVRLLFEYKTTFTMGEAIQGQTGDSWHMLACVDRLVELGYIEEVNVGKVAGQHRVFRAGPKFKR